MLELPRESGALRLSLFRDWLYAWDLRFEAEFALLDELAAQGKAPDQRARRLKLHHAQIDGLRALERKFAAHGEVLNGEHLIVKAARLKAQAALERDRKKDEKE